MNFIVQKATIVDLKRICQFTDFWLAGRGLKQKAAGAVNDYFVSPSQHKKYIEKYTTYMGFTHAALIAWAVIENNDTLIHFLISGNYRKLGIGSTFLKELSPRLIRSKSNQSSGDPGPFYVKLGYKKIKTIKSQSRFDIDKIRPHRPKIIDIFQKVNNVT